MAPRGGFLHIAPDWRITYAHLEGGRATDSMGTDLVGKVLWEIYPDVLGTPFERNYREAMADRKPRVFQATYGAGIQLENRLFPAGDGLALIYEDVTSRRAVEQQLERRNIQQDAVARLGQAALEGIEVGALIDQAVREVATALDVPFAKLVEPIGDGTMLLLRAGVGWRPGLVGQATVSAEGGSQAGFALRAHGTVIVEDLRKETRFVAPPLFLEHGIASGLSVLVGPKDFPLGVLGAHTTTPRQFTQDDINFMQAVANLLGAAIARSRIEAELRRHRDDLEGLVRDRTRLLEASNKELEAFGYTVSHDLRTPLRAIDGFSQLLVRQYSAQLPPAARDFLVRVQENAQRMGHLIESLLALSRLGRKQLMPVKVDVTRLARQVVDTLAISSPERHVTVTVQEGLVAFADEELVHILLENLLGNSWKFTAGRPKATIEVGQEAGGPERAFFVRDNGAGFDMAHAGNLFQPFQRLHAPHEFEGTGVGLATVHRIVQRHGCTAWAKAQPGKGATIFFTLPRVPTGPGGAPLPSKAGEPAPAAS